MVLNVGYFIIIVICAILRWPSNIVRHCIGVQWTVTDIDNILQPVYLEHWPTFQGNKSTVHNTNNSIVCTFKYN